MKQERGTLLAAFKAIKSGEFENAFELADSVIRKDINNFWAWYIAAVSLGFLNRIKTFEHYVERAKALNPDSGYLLYLQSYISLTKNDLESALVNWTRLVDLEEGWLARELIEKARKGVDLVEKADKGNISAFIVIPDFTKRMESEVVEPDISFELPQETFPDKPRKSSFIKSLIKNFAVIVAIAALAMLLKNPVINFIKKEPDSQSVMWKNLKIDEWAALVNQQHPQKDQYLFKNKDQLIDDFENAKKYLTEKKINQARFILQRILGSNADFKTKEKSKIFLSFIPEPDYQDFSDPLFPEQILEFPGFYTDCLVLWQGTVLKMKDVEHGKELRLLIKDQSSDYIVDAFLPGSEKKSNWLPFSDYQQRKELAEKKSQAIVYGKFKGLIGKQKVLYLELVQLWM